MFVDSGEAASIKKQLRGDLKSVIFDESHMISLPAPPKVDLEYEPEPIPAEGFERLQEVYSNFLNLLRTLGTEGVFESIEEDLKYAGTSCRLARRYPNDHPIPSYISRKVFGDLRKLARNRHRLGYSEADILFLRDLCAVMSDDEICVSFVRISEGDQWNLVGLHNSLQIAIMRFIEEICPPGVKVFFVSGTQMESHPGLFAELAGRKLETICLQIKNNNRAMTIYADTWKLDTRNFGGRFGDICKAIQEVSKQEKGAAIYLVAMSRIMKERLEKALKKGLPNIEFDYYRSDRSIGVENPARVGIFVGFPATPTNSQDWAALTYEESQERRQLEMLSTAWQTMSRIKDWAGKEPSRAYCIGVTSEQVSQIVIQGSNLRAKYISKGVIEVTVDEALTTPAILVPYKKQVHSSRRKALPYIKTIWDSDGDLVGCPLQVYTIGKGQDGSFLFTSGGDMGHKFSKSTYNNICDFGEKRSHVPRANEYNYGYINAFGAIFSQPKNEFERKITIDTLNLFFRSKWSAHAEQRANGSYYPHDTENWDDLMAAMLRGDVTVASYCIGDDGLTVQCAYDVDNHKGNNPAKPRVAALVAHTEGLGLQAIPIASGSADSYHIHIPILRTEPGTSHEFMENMRNEVRQAHEDLDFQHDTEVFPKQKNAKSEYGNPLKLPLAVNRKSNRRSQLIDPHTLQPVDAIFITRVVELRQPEKEAVGIGPKQYIPAPVRHCRVRGSMRPCIVAALDKQLDGDEGNAMRVAAVCEALAAGKTREEIIRMFEGQADFDEAVTAKHVDYIAAQGYRQWRCETLQNRCVSLVDCDSCPSGKTKPVVTELLVEPNVER